MKQSFLILSLAMSLSYGNNAIISGFVTDSASGEVLIGANVFLKETGQGMAADLNGYYIIQNIVPGTYTIMTSYVGFDLFKKKNYLKYWRIN